MRRSSAALALAVLVGVAAGCGGSRPSGARLDAASQSYRADELAFVLDAVGTLQQGEPGVDVYLGVPRSSLVFRPSADQLTAVVRWTVTLETPGQPTRTLTPVDTVAAEPGQSRDPAPVWRILRADVPPGRYLVRATIEDRTSEHTADLEVTVDVFGADDRAGLGTLRLEGLGEDGMTPVDPASVPAGLDSLWAVTQGTALPDGAATVLSVVRLRSDDQPAPPPTDFTPAPGTLARRGIDPSQMDTVQVVRQVVTAPSDAVDIIAPLPVLPPGVYAVRLDLVAPDGTALDTADRLVVVRRTDYPVPTRLGDLIEPLAYLATPRELARIIDAPASRQRAAFDRFWGESLDDRRLAAATVRAYYERVEEANRQFGSYKEGWKTDPGMVYILFGPPSYIEATAEGERWFYAQGGGAPAFVDFERTAGRAGESGLFRVLTMVRDRAYSDVWLHARRQWRSGVVP